MSVVVHVGMRCRLGNGDGRCNGWRREPGGGGKKKVENERKSCSESYRKAMEKGGISSIKMIDEEEGKTLFWNMARFRYGIDEWPNNVINSTTLYSACFISFILGPKGPCHLCPPLPVEKQRDERGTYYLDS